MKKIFFILLLIVYNLVYSQSNLNTKFDGQIHERIYSIEVADFQFLELIEFKNRFEGNLIHIVYKVDKKENRIDSIIQKIEVSESIVKKMILNLNEIGFEEIKDCREVENCRIGLDGTTISFYTFKNDKYNVASFWELESDYYYNQNIEKIPNEVLKARKVFAIINNEFDLRKYFDDFLDSLPLGRYEFNSIIMEKKKRLNN